MNEPTAPPRPPFPLARWTLIALAVGGLAGAFAYVAGYLDPQRLTPARVVDQLQANGGVHPGYRRNHAKGVCVIGRFDSSGKAAPYSRAALFAAGARTPLVGRFALPGGNPYAPDGGVPIRSLALRLTQADGQQWRTGMNNMPVFPVATPQAFYEQLRATAPDPATGKPDPARQKAFFEAHPETAAFRAWIKDQKPSASYATDAYYGLNAFYFVGADGARHAVRWQVEPDNGAAAAPLGAQDVNTLAAELERRLNQAPLRWRLWATLAAPGDPVDDATQSWPAQRPRIDAGTVILERAQDQDSGECRDINYDPLVLPDGIVASADPLLPARSAAYAESYRRRTYEEARAGGRPPREAAR
ncbi:MULTISPECIES: catalase family peroxidase [Lysobacter]|uniref:Catalase-related peroxidase n=1 Tax=Lysobacter yananisis TaxID=1003114 RepID=A0ABY9PC76_9GAMM|nr:MULTISPECIES: catalase family peroxidase [Lysobacter]QQQ01522.1 catalase family peroxidase [Lysobacter enzymogenes]WMT04670.1 catalase family peroxidase [Lysobacter yananisis]